MADAHDPRGSGTHPIHRLLQTMATLRGPDGCPWDRAQTHRSLLPYLVEEAYELIEAAESDDDAALREELGDVLLQVVFHAQVAEERGAFTFAEVAAGLDEKLRERHPHVFGGTPLETPDAVNAAWHARKMLARNSALDGVPHALPALQLAAQTSSRAARSGFEWNHRGEILAKAAEELEEFRAALEAPETQPPPEDAEAELGDLLFAMVQLARWQRIDPEAALRRATRKFSARFRWMEEALRARGLQPEAQGPDQWWALWDEAKAALG
ncbi:MAG TPA: nucleoside triphosphate pyrophosphohydrolase [bacterium]|nr:nucleoside triphosphate pyrophosphohydrolase [bacterium]